MDQIQLSWSAFIESTDQTIKSEYRPIITGGRSIGASLIITGHFEFTGF